MPTPFLQEVEYSLMPLQVTLVLLGLNLANLDFFHAFRYFLSLFAFASGVLIISLIQKRIKYITLIHWREIVLATEIILIFVVGLIPNQYDTIANIICTIYLCYTVFYI